MAAAIKNIDVEFVQSYGDVDKTLSGNYRRDPMVMPIVAMPNISIYQPPLTRKQRRLLNRKK